MCPYPPALVVLRKKDKAYNNYRMTDQGTLRPMEVEVDYRAALQGVRNVQEAVQEARGSL